MTYRIVRVDLSAPLGVRTAVVVAAGLTHEEVVAFIDARRLTRNRGSRFVEAVQGES